MYSVIGMTVHNYCVMIIQKVFILPMRVEKNVMSSQSEDKRQEQIDQANKVSAEALAKLQKEKYQREKNEYLEKALRDRVAADAANLEKLRDKHKTVGRDGKESTQSKDLDA